MVEVEVPDMILEDVVAQELEDDHQKEVIIVLLFLTYQTDAIGQNLKITFDK
jgi:hypothetical protein